MKSLNDVIAEMEYEAEYNSGEWRDIDAEALYHLKEYQEMLNNVENDPLSWEELHLLENKPVWVEHKFYKQWAIITGFGVDDNIVRFEGKQLYAPEFKEDMGERWNAYRKERK